MVAADSIGASAVQAPQYAGISGFSPEVMLLSIFDVMWLSSDDPSEDAADEAEEEAEKAAEEAAEQAAQEAEEAAEQAAEEAAEQAAEEAEKAAEKAAEEAAEQAEQAAEQAAEEAAEQAEKAAEEAAEKAAREAERAAEEAAEDAAEEAEEVAEEAAKQVEEAAEEAAKQAEETAEESAKQAEEAAEEAAKEAEEAAKQAEAEAEEAQELAREGEVQAEKEAEEQAEREAEEAGEDHSGHDDDHDEDRDNDESHRLSETREHMVERLREFNEFTDDEGFEAVADELLVLADRGSDLKLDKSQIDQIEQLDGLGMVLVRVRASGEKKVQDLAGEMSGTIENADVDLNHLFRPDAQQDGQAVTSVDPANYSRDFNLRESGRGDLSVGLIDSKVDRSHPALQNGNITDKDLVPFNYIRPSSHGTAVASLLVGDDETFHGLLPGGKLYAASVFFQTPDGATVATTESLILALDWLVRQKVRVINMSLSGPPNKLLELALRRVSEKGSVVVAAVGNGGPASGPLFPAAYDGVIAVTAVDNHRKVYLRASRGPHVAFSAPGVDIRVARADGGYDIQTGTSIAAPFVSAILADMISRKGTEWKKEDLDILRKTAIDLGAPGFDEIYGHGLIRAVEE